MRNFKKGFTTGVLATIGAVGLAAFLVKKGNKSWNMQGWAEDMRDEVLEKAKAAKKLSREEYFRIVDIAADHYRNLQDVSFSELVDLADDLKKEWGRIKEEVGAMAMAGDEDDD